MPMKKLKKVLIFLTILTIGLLLNRKFQWDAYLLNPNNFEKINIFVDNNYFLAILIYQVFTIIGSSILAIPGATFAIVASGMFGPWLGSLYCLIGTTIGALFSYLLSKYLLKDTIKDLVTKNKRLHNILYQMDPNKEMLILMITRLLPIFPFNLQNFAYGITDISASKYTMGTFIFMIPGIFLFSIGTEGVINKDSRNLMFLIVIIILIFTILISIFLYKKYKTLEIGGQHKE